MEDRRIRKTKKNLKNTFIEMLEDMPFEKITVTDICKRSDISRITFYTHYSDKYALVDDIFKDMVNIGTEKYHARQGKNNPEYNAVKSYNNILLSILDLFYAHPEFFKYTSPEANPYLAFTFYNTVLKAIELHTIKESKMHNLKYTPKQITGFLCYGLGGFISQSHEENIPTNEIRRQASRLLTAMLSSDFLVE